MENDTLKIIEKLAKAVELEHESQKMLAQIIRDLDARVKELEAYAADGLHGE